jgi:hypothetical protein
MHKFLRTIAKTFLSLLLLLALLITLFPYWISSSYGNRWLSNLIEDQLINQFNHPGQVTIEELEFQWNGNIKMQRCLYESSLVSCSLQDTSISIPLYQALLQPSHFFNLQKKDRLLGKNHVSTYLLRLPTRLSLSLGSGCIKIKDDSHAQTTFSLEASLPEEGTEISVQCRGTASSLDKGGSFHIDSILAGLDKDRTIALYRNSAGLFQLPRQQKINLNLDIESLPIELIPVTTFDLRSLIGPHFSAKAQLTAAHEQINLHSNCISPLLEVNCGLSTVDKQVLLSDATELKLQITPQLIASSPLGQNLSLQKTGQLSLIVEQFVLPFEDGTANLGHLLLNARCYFNEIEAYDAVNQEKLTFDEVRCTLKTPDLAQQVSLQLKSKIHYNKKICNVDLSTRFQNLIAQQENATVAFNLDHAKSDTTVAIDNLPLAWIERVLKKPITPYLGNNLSCVLELASEGKFLQGSSSLHSDALNFDSISFNLNQHTGFISTSTPIYYTPTAQLLSAIAPDSPQILITDPVELQIKSFRFPLDLKEPLSPKTLQECQVDAALYLSKCAISNSPFSGSLQKLVIKLQQNEKTESPLFCEALVTYLPIGPTLQGALGLQNQCKLTLTTSNTNKAHHRYQLHLQADSELYQVQGTVGYDLQQAKIRLINPFTCNYQLQPHLLQTLLRQRNPSSNVPIEMIQPATITMEIAPIELSLAKKALLSDLHASFEISNVSLIAPTTLKDPLVFPKCTIALNADPKKKHIELNTIFNLLNQSELRKVYWNLKINDMPFNSMPDLQKTTFQSNLSIDPYPIGSLIPILDSHDLQLLQRILGPTIQLNLNSKGSFSNLSHHSLEIVTENLHANTNLEISPANIRLIPKERHHLLLKLTPQSFAQLLPLSGRERSISLQDPVTINCELEHLLLPISSDLHPLVPQLECKATISTDNIKCKSTLQPNHHIEIQNVVMKLDTPKLLEKVVANLSMSLQSRDNSKVTTQKSQVNLTLTNAFDKDNSFQLQNAGIQLEGQLEQIPTSLILPLLQLSPTDFEVAYASLGNSISTSLNLNLLQLQGVSSISVASPTLQLNLAGQITQGVLRPTSQGTIKWDATPEFCQKVSQRIGVEKLNLKRIDAPLHITIPVAGTSLPLYPFSLNNVNLGETTISIGKIFVNTTSSLQKGFNFLKIQGNSEELSTWLTPIYVDIRNGNFKIDRFDLLFGRAIHAVCWGQGSLPRDRIDCVLGITGSTISSIKHIALPAEYVFELPIVGKLSAPTIDWPLAATRYGALELSSLSRGAGALGLAIDLFSKKGKSTQAPPLRQPLPWSQPPESPELIFPSAPQAQQRQDPSPSTNEEPIDGKKQLQQQLLRFSKGLFGD